MEESIASIGFQDDQEFKINVDHAEINEVGLLFEIAPVPKWVEDS